MIKALRIVFFLGMTFFGLLMLGASFWRALFGTLALAALRATPAPAAVVYGIGAVVFALGILEWSTGAIIAR